MPLTKIESGNLVVEGTDCVESFQLLLRAYSNAGKSRIDELLFEIANAAFGEQDYAKATELE